MQCTHIFPGMPDLAFSCNLPCLWLLKYLIPSLLPSTANLTHSEPVNMQSWVSMILSQECKQKDYIHDGVHVGMVFYADRTCHDEAKVNWRERSQSVSFVSQHAVGSETMCEQRKLSEAEETSKKKLLENKSHCDSSSYSSWRKICFPLSLAVLFLNILPH